MSDLRASLIALFVVLATACSSPGTGGTGGGAAGGTAGGGSAGGGSTGGGGTGGGNAGGAAGGTAGGTAGGAAGGAAGGSAIGDTWAISASGKLLNFDRATAGTILSSRAITGLGAETILGGDFRPANGGLYVLTNTHLYRVDLTTAAVGMGVTLAADPADATAPFTALTGTAFGVDFNPVADRLRVVTSTGLNLRINVATGLVTTDTDLNPSTAGVTAAAYTNAVAGAATTTLYVINTLTDTLEILNPPNNGTRVTVGTTLGIDVVATNAFDIDAHNDVGYLATQTGTTSSTLYTINLATGVAASPIVIGGGEPVIVLAMPVLVLNVYAVTADNRLIVINTLGTVTATPVGPITGLGASETALGLDLRPSTGELVMLSSLGKLYVLDRQTAAATGAVTLSSGLTGTTFGIDFNPVVDRLRVMTNTGQNVRVNPADGSVIVDTAVTVMPAQPNAASVMGVAYTHSVAGATTTTMYAIDSANGTLCLASNPNSGVLTVVGSLGLAPISGVGAFEIAGPADPFVLAAFVLTGATTTTLYRIDLTTGAATLVGPLLGPQVVGLAVQYR